jgi:hypothetical protein
MDEPIVITWGFAIKTIGVLLSIPIYGLAIAAVPWLMQFGLAFGAITDLIWP